MTCSMCKRAIEMWERVEHPKPINEGPNVCKDCRVESKADLVDTRINMFLERGIYESRADVLSAAMDLLVESQIEKESKHWGHTIESGCHPDCPEWEGPMLVESKAQIEMTKEEKAKKFANERCQQYARPSGFASAVAGYLAGYDDNQARADGLLDALKGMERKYIGAMSKLVRAETLIADMTEGFEGTIGREFWESPLGQKVKAYRESK